MIHPRNNSLERLSGHTGLVYDALEMSNDPAGRYDPDGFTALIEPTIFYRKSEDGLQEAVDFARDDKGGENRGCVTVPFGISKGNSGRYDAG
jgi:hypothetical protein